MSNKTEKFLQKHLNKIIVVSILYICLTVHYSLREIAPVIPTINNLEVRVDKLEKELEYDWFSDIAKMKYSLMEHTHRYHDDRAVWTGYNPPRQLRGEIRDNSPSNRQM